MDECKLKTKNAKKGGNHRATVMFFFTAFGGAVAAFSVQGGKTELLLSASAPAAVSLLCMASLFLLSFVPAKSEKEPIFNRIKGKFTYFKHSQTKKYVLK